MDRSHWAISEYSGKGQPINAQHNIWHVINVFAKWNFRFFRESCTSFRYSDKSKILLFFLFFFWHGFGVRDLHVIITKPSEIWLWVLGFRVPRLALIWELEDGDEKKHIKLAGSMSKEMNNIRLSMSFTELLEAFQRITQCKNHVALQKHSRQSFWMEEIPSYH